MIFGFDIAASGVVVILNLFFSLSPSAMSILYSKIIEFLSAEWHFKLSDCLR